MARHHRAPAEKKQESSGKSTEEPEGVRIRLLGDFRVSVGDRVIEENSWRLRKAAGLVKLLALAEGHTLHRERAMDLLWPDLGPDPVSNNLRAQRGGACRRAGPSRPGSPRGRHSYEDLSRTGLGPRDFERLHRLGRSVVAEADRPHGLPFVPLSRAHCHESNLLFRAETMRPGTPRTYAFRPSSRFAPPGVRFRLGVHYAARRTARPLPRCWRAAQRRS